MTPRRAIARAELLTIGVAAGTIGVGAALVGPGFLSASTAGESTAVTPLDPELAGACDAIRALFEGSREILGVWTENETGFAEILIWHRDIHDPGRINRDEVVLLTHSASMRTLAAYTCAGDDGPDLAEELGVELDEPTAAAPDPCGSELPRSRINGDFPWRWRTASDTTREVVATDLAELRAERVRERGGADRWRVRVVWVPETADDEPEACAFDVDPGR